MGTRNAFFGVPALAAAASALALSSHADAATYRVGPGNTYAALDDVVSMLMPGDIVEIDGDHTYAGGVILDRSGSAAQKITIRGVRVNGKRPVFSGATNTIEVQADHVVFEGIEVTAGSFRCFYHHGDDITLRDAAIHDCPRHGLLGADTDSGSLLMEYVEVYKCGGGDRDHQIYMATDERTHAGAVFRMQHCYVHDGNGGNNVKSRAERNEIYYNWLEGAFYHELELIGPDPAGGTAEDLKREDSDVVGNVLWQKNTSAVMRFGGDATGQSNGRYRFVNNTVVVQPAGGAVFRLFDGLESVEMHNNVFFASGGGVNLKREVEAVWTTGAAVIAGTNNWIVTGSTNAPTQWTNTATGADPSFAALATRDLRPTMASPLVDKGNAAPVGPAGRAFPNPLAVPLFHPPMGAVAAAGTAQPRATVGTIDVGAFEFGVPADGGGTGAGGAGGNAGRDGGAGTAGTGGAGGGGGNGTGGVTTGTGSSGAAGDGTTSASSTATGSSTGTSGPGTATGTGTNTGATGTTASGTTGGANAPEAEEGGCGCRMRRTSSIGAVPSALVLALLSLARRRRPRWLRAPRGRPLRLRNAPRCKRPAGSPEVSARTPDNRSSSERTRGS